MSKKQVWFSLPAEYSPDGSGTGSDAGPAFSWHEFSSLREYSGNTDDSDLSQYNSPPRSLLTGQELSQYSLRPSMEVNPNSETVSTNDSQDISTSQQESTMSDGQYGYDDANSTSSIHDSPHDEAVSSAIMEVSGELMLGRFSSQRGGSGGSESSELSDDDIRRPPSGGAIAKYPESSTGLSDNDWNPYATESDTNQTPRSPRSTASDEQNRVGFVSKATFSIAQPKDATTTVSMSTGEVTVGEMKPESIVMSGKQVDNIAANGRNGGDRLDILRYVMDDDGMQADNRRIDIGRKEIRSLEDDLRRESPDTARSGYTEGSLSGRQSTESGQSLDTLRRESAESARSLQSDGTGTRSGRQSSDSAHSGRSSRSDLDRSGESGFSGRQSADSQHSVQSGRSRGSQKSTGRSIGSDRSDRLERLSDAAGDNLKELMQFESSQRVAPGSDNEDLAETKEELQTRARRDGSGDSVARTRLTARLEPYTSPVRSSKSPERSSNVAGSSGYVSIAERERLLSDSPDISQQGRRLDEETNGTRYDTTLDLNYERTKPSHSSANLPRSSDPLSDRSPSNISMRRVADLFEETKRQVREAVAIPRPDPSGSEERFPLRERLTWPLHDDSFKEQDKADFEERTERKLEKPRDSEAARSLTSEEVARVLGKYAEDEVSRSQKSTDLPDVATSDGAVMVSAFDKVNDDQTELSELPRRNMRAHDTLDSLKAEEVSDDEISKRVKALLSETDRLGVLREDGTHGKRQEYIPRTIDYSRLQKDLQEIQDSLHDVPPPTANDSIHIQRKNLLEGLNGEINGLPKDDPRSLETTCTTSGGRESGVSEYGRRLVWDHGADLEYDEGYAGQFIGTMTTTDTLSTRLRGTGDTDTLTVRPDSAVTDDTDNYASEPEGTKTLTGTDITRAERIVEQVMNRRAEGDLKESVEDIIARYRNERKDLFDRLQAPAVPKASQNVEDAEIEVRYPAAKSDRPILKDPDVELSVSQQNGIPNQRPNVTKQPGLAERVFKILTSEQNDVDNSDNQEEKGMAKKVYKILANDRPQEQVNGILTETMTEEHEMLKKLVTKPKEDSSLDDSGLNGTTESLDIDDKDIRKQLEYSQFSSPGKGEKSDFNALREVTAAPYSALSTAKSLLSTQLKKMSERNFDKSVELRTPYRQAIDCYPVYGVERLGQHEPDPSEPREAWMPSRRSAGSTATGERDRDRALSSERFFITDKDHTKRDFDGTQQRSRTYSDPFEVSPGRRAVSSERLGKEGHARSRSEEVGNVSELSQYSFAEPEYSPSERRTAQSPRSLRPAGTLATPQQHRAQAKVIKKAVNSTAPKQKEWSFECYTSVSDSSDPHRHSDSSDANMWRYHGYQMHDQSRDPENDLYIPERPDSPSKTSKRNWSVSNGVSQGDKKMKPGQNFESPVKSVKYTRQSRSREKKRRNQVNFQCEGRMSQSLPAYYPKQGFVEKVPISTDDVYELLTRSQAQEEKLAELRKQLLGQQEISQNSSSSSFQSPRGQSEMSNHGNKAYVSMNTQEQNPYNGMLMRNGHMQQSSSPSPTESDTSGSRKGARLRPYRPAGTRDVYYTESGDDNNESGTTIESSHPGSDDAAPPYIPNQYLGTRREEPVRHPTGIYGNKEKDALSTIDENSVKDEKEKALSASGGSGKQGASSDKHSTVTADTGYQTATVRSRSPADPESLRTSSLERPGFKTREEFQRDFEKRERELKELLSKRTEVEPHRDSLGTSTRSDPGGMLEDPGSRWEYRQSDQMNEFRRLEPEPAYPEDRLRYSRSKSDTDLVAISPEESQRYSSPMQPGTRFLEFSTQQSPIFAHHDSVTYQTRGAPGGVPADLPRVPIERERTQPPLPQELPRVYDRRPVLKTPELPSTDERRVTPTNMKEYPVRPLEPGEPQVRPLEPGSRSQAQRPGDALGPVDIGADPRKLGQFRRNVTEDRERTKSPLQVRQKEMEAELEKLNKQLSDQVNEIQEKKPKENFEDNFPPSKKAQALREVLEQEYMENLPPNINDMWTRFKERKEHQSVSESSLNSTRLDALSGLLQNPTQHEVNSFIREKRDLNERQKMEEKEKAEKLREERLREMELEKKAAAEKAAQQRKLRRQELKNRHGLSEEESNGSYSEILIENEKKREQRRKRDETKAGRRERKDGRSTSPSKKVTELNEDRRKDRNKAERVTEERRKSRNSKTKDEGSLTDIRARNGANRHSDTMDTLFSIPEDASFEQSPSKIESEMKSRQRRQRHVIDPLMKKLRDKIKMQRVKIDKERRKELQRVEKLKKLEMLLNAKRKGKLSDKAIDVELGDVSSTTSVSHTESSHMSDSTLTGLSTAVESDISSQGSTTLKDSTIDSSIKLRVKKYPSEDYRDPRTCYVDSDTTETSDFSNIVVERIPERKSEKKSKEKKASSKGKKSKVDEYGNRIRKEKKDKRKKDVFGVELTEKDIVNQIKRYENYMTPERQRLMRVENYLSPQRQGYMRDASTMYPSPITVSPPSRRRMREVLMKSEAIQTSPSVRSSSPSHAYDEVPVAPVPYMSRKSAKTSRRRPSPSPTRSAQTSFSASPPRKSTSTSQSPSTRKSSRSPSVRKTSRSPTAGSRRFSPQITRRQARSPMWKPESETSPPENSMFTPEGNENIAPNTLDRKEAESWFVPMKPSQPWRQPLKERQAFAVRQQAWEPKSVSQSTWKDIIHGDVLKDKGDPNDISRDTKFDLDPEGQPLGEDETLTDSEEEADISRSKPLSKMSLQEAFQIRRANVISRLRERQKRLNLAAEQRKMEAFLKLERDRLFQEERKKEANPDAHPYSDNLYRPARRVISKEEMKEMTKKRYKKLPEVIERQKVKKREDDYSVNRIKARLFNRKIQKKVLEKAEKWGR